ncbi:unnamed protein product [Pylaiella littoralis]
MEAITSRLNREKFEVIVFGDACIMDAPVEDWPLCDCLVAFYSTGFPSDKAEAYVKLRRPYALNNLEMQDVLHDRRRVYDLLKGQGVPHAENVYASRDGYGGQKLEELEIVEADDYIQVNNTTIHKPFVEKPVDAENHNVYIYYPMSAGGGSKRLFRKIGDRSSEFYPNANEIRREGSFVYESFVETQGTDVKVYTVGPDYGHAEARKSPTLDGKVNRNAEGKEIRYPVILTSEEKEYARKITLAFRQCVCGFDILRVQGRSFVCDVNGWSFVKNSRKYVDDCAMLLQEFIEAAVKPGRRTKLFSTEVPLIKYKTIKPHLQQQPQQQLQQQRQQQPVAGEVGLIITERPPRINTLGSKEVGAGTFAPIGSPASTPPRSPTEYGKSSLKHQRKHPEELRAVIAITRHGDRTPKQKMKMKISFPEFMAFYNKYSPGPRKEIKVKGKLHLKEFLGITVELIKTLRVTPGPSSLSSLSNGLPLAQKVKEAASAEDVDAAGAAAATAGGDAAMATAAGATEAAAAASAADSGTTAATQEQAVPAPAEPAFTEVDAETYGKLHQIKHVLERWEISGINRKLQLKPRKWEEVDASTLQGGRKDGAARPESRTRGAGGRAGGTGSGSEPGSSSQGGPVLNKDTIRQGAMNEDTLSKGAAPRNEGATGGGDNDEGERGSGKVERASQLLLILKWGGELTNLGQRQAIELGNSFRTIMYPDSGTGGLLRLHSTFRHDLKIKTSDEGRVMKTAAAFAKGFLELEGDLTPILVSLVSKESSKNSSVMMLDPSGNKDITKDMDLSKDFLQRVMAKDVTFSPELIKSVVPTGQASVRRALRSVGNPVAKLTHLRELVMVLVKQLSRRSATFPLGTTDRVSAADRELDRGIEADEFATSRVERAEAREKEKRLQKQQSETSLPTSRDSRLPSRGETPLLMLDRWRKLHDELHDSATGFDITKIPDVHDNARYDCLHNAHLDLDGLPELYDLAKHLADSIVPQEYGITKGGKLLIGSKMCHALMHKIKYDLLIAMADSEVDMRYQLDLSHMEDLPINSLARRVRTRLYFTSESHLHTLLNVLRFPIGKHEAVVTEEAMRMLSRTKELCYLTSFVIRLFEDTEKAPEDPARFRVEILFSPGVVKHPMLPGDHLHTAPLVPLHKHLTCKQVEETLNAAIGLAAHETVPDDHSEAEAILHKLDRVARGKSVDSKGGSSGGGGGTSSSSGRSSTAAASSSTSTSSNGGVAAAAVPAAGYTAGGVSHQPARDSTIEHDKQGIVGGDGDPKRQRRDDDQQQQQQQQQQGKKESQEEDVAVERQCWYYGGGGWGKGKGEDKEKEKKPRRNSWLSSVTRAASSDQSAQRQQQLQQHESRGYDQEQQQHMQHMQHQEQHTDDDGYAAERGADDEEEDDDNNCCPPEEDGEEGEADDMGMLEGQDGEEGDEEEEEEEEEDREEDEDDQGTEGDERCCTDDEIDNDDEDEGFESDVGRHAKARLASDSYLSMPCESGDSVSSAPPDNDEGAGGYDQRARRRGGQQHQHQQHQHQHQHQQRRNNSLSRRPRSRGHSGREASKGGSKSSGRKRSLSRRASGADSLAGSDSYDRSAYTVVVALGVLGVAAAAAGVAVVMARARRT